MSAFIVNDVTIQRIVTWFETCNDEHLVDEARKIGHTTDTNEECKKLCNEFLAMNTRAVNERYSDNLKLRRMPFRRMHDGEIQVLKSMQCLRYQCNEGEVPKEKLFKFLGLMIDKLVFKIIHNLPEYEEAVWG